MLDAVREGTSIAYNGRRTPGVPTQYIPQLKLYSARPWMLGLAGHHRKAVPDSACAAGAHMHSATLRNTYQAI
jgi:hypothetical protein